MSEPAPFVPMQLRQSQMPNLAVGGPTGHSNHRAYPMPSYPFLGEAADGNYWYYCQASASYHPTSSPGTTTSPFPSFHNHRLDSASLSPGPSGSWSFPATDTPVDAFPHPIPPVDPLLDYCHQATLYPDPSGLVQQTHGHTVGPSKDAFRPSSPSSPMAGNFVGLHHTVDHSFHEMLRSEHFLTPRLVSQTDRERCRTTLQWNTRLGQGFYPTTISDMLEKDTPVEDRRSVEAVDTQKRVQSLSPSRLPSLAPQPTANEHEEARLPRRSKRVGGRRAPFTPQVTQGQNEKAYSSKARQRKQPKKSPIGKAVSSRPLSKGLGRPLICVFDHAGCHKTFRRRNEWKRHVLRQHMALEYWFCVEGLCRDNVGESPKRRRSASLPTKGSIFNRIDLFKQHVLRAHVPAEMKSTAVDKGAKAAQFVSPQSGDAWDSRFETLQKMAHRTRCQPPSYMRCPRRDCAAEFLGEHAWDNRMDHVAEHLCRGQPVSFGGDDDPTLMEWAAADGIGIVQPAARGGWRLCNPLANAHAEGKQAVRECICEEEEEHEGADMHDEDAEGEEF